MSIMTRKKITVFMAPMFLILVAVFFNWTLITSPEKASALAATNLINGGGFEGNIDTDWILWNNNSSREYQLSRSYGFQNMPTGLGSYSALISAEGTSGDRWQTGISSKKAFVLEANKDYYLTFYAKSQNSPLEILAYLNDGSAPTTEIITVTIGTDWEKHTIAFTPTKGGQSYFSFVFGDMSAGSFIMDGVGLYKSDIKISNPEVRGYIGTEARLSVTGLEMLSAKELKVELPYFDSVSGEKKTIQIAPKKIENGYITFDFQSGTYAGVGKIIANNEEVGLFNYNVQIKLTAIHPEVVRADESITIVGTGFHPDIANNVYVIMKAVDVAGKNYEHWAKPTVIDSALTQITVATPNGIIPDSLSVRVSYADKDNEVKINKSNSLAYKVKPVIYSVTWSKSGYDQVGDKLKISGKGLGYRPKVIFYDMSDKQIDFKVGQMTEVSDSEYVEVVSTSKVNQYKIAVAVGNIESDAANMVEYVAKPKLQSIATSYARAEQNNRIQAAKVGDIITLNGTGFSSYSTSVEFSGINSTRVRVGIPTGDISVGGGSLKVQVPAGAVNGYVGVVVNGQTSNYLSLEIIPTIVSYSPENMTSESSMTIVASGVGTDLDKITVNFAANGQKDSVKPRSVTHSGGYANISLTTPALIAKNSVLSLTYDNWSSTVSAIANIRPNIKSAGFNEDTKILTIKGSGFSSLMKDNQITYMYADAAKTVITPKAKVLGIFQTVDGQEIRIQISDNYHYGYVTVTSGGIISNEAQFGPVNVTRIARRVEYVKADSQVMGVLYISGYNLGKRGGVRVGDVWANVHYRDDFFIIAVVPQSDTNKNPVVVARE